MHLKRPLLPCIPPSAPLFSQNTLRFLCVGFLLLFGLFFFLEYGITQSVHPLNLAILFIGIMNCLFSIYVVRVSAVVSSEYCLALSGLLGGRVLPLLRPFPLLPTTSHLPFPCSPHASDIYDDLISRRVNSSDAEVFARTCPCPFNGVCWGVIWGVISLLLAGAAVYLGLVILA
ncbi:unnamed protein product [Closterium sp. NIES-54]